MPPLDRVHAREGFLQYEGTQVRDLKLVLHWFHVALLSDDEQQITVRQWADAYYASYHLVRRPVNPRQLGPCHGPDVTRLIVLALNVLIRTPHLKKPKKRAWILSRIAHVNAYWESAPWFIGTGMRASDHKDVKGLFYDLLAAQKAWAEDVLDRHLSVWFWRPGGFYEQRIAKSERWEHNQEVAHKRARR